MHSLKIPTDNPQAALLFCQKLAASLEKAQETTPGAALDAAPTISVVVPVYDEQENLPTLYGRLTDVLGDYKPSYEIIFVDDGNRHQLLIVCLTYRKRAIPIAWTWVPQVQGHSSAGKQLALLAYVRNLISARAAVFLVGDCEFGPVGVLRQLERWHWFYVLRQKSDICLWFSEEQGWQPFGSFIQQPGQSYWLGTGYLSRNHIFQVNLLTHWKRTAKEPWCLATNLPDKGMALRFYRRHSWIEEMFGDFKKHGFDLETMKLSHLQRLSRLTLAVAILYVWLVSVGTPNHPFW